MAQQHTITVKNVPIRLGQFLKHANLVQDGFEAKIRIQHGEVLLNGKVETQRGKQLVVGDVISYEEKEYVVVNQPL